jgi:hypothetical protein
MGNMNIMASRLNTVPIAREGTCEVFTVRFTLRDA